MKEYINMVYELIEIPRNELRYKVFVNKEKELENLLEDYEIAYYKSCLKIEKFLDDELENKDFSHLD